MAFVGTGWRRWLCAVLVFLAVASVAAAEGDLAGDDLDLIAPPDLSSPRATLNALRTNAERAYELFVKANEQYRNDPGFFASPEVDEQIRIVNLLLRRAMTTLDLSGVPLINREQTGTETVLLLLEILERLPPIDPATVPDGAAVAADDLTAWTLPYTDFDIVKMAEGPRAGQFVFSTDTIAEAPVFYETVRPYGGRVQSGTDLYRFITLTPGDLLPPKWYRLIETLPIWMQTRFFLGLALWQWVGIALVALILFGGWLLAIRAILHRGGDGDGAPRSFVRRMAPPLLLIGVALLAQWIIVHQISVSGPVLAVTNIVLEGVAYLAAAWAAYLVSARLGERVAVSSGVGGTSIDASLIRIAGRLLGIAAAITIIFVGATDIGLPLYGVIAGLGVGGLALGLAARPTLENLIGGFTLYADRPVRVGEICKFGDQFGIVEEIGLRSTRLRALDRTPITVPNADFSNMVLVNFTRRDKTMLDTTIGLRYGTTAAQLQTILDGIRTLLEGNPDVDPDDIRVRFEAFGAYGLAIMIRAYIRTKHTSVFLEKQEAILFGIMKVIEDAGAEIAVMPMMVPAGGQAGVAPAEAASGE